MVNLPAGAFKFAPGAVIQNRTTKSLAEVREAMVTTKGRFYQIWSEDTSDEHKAKNLMFDATIVEMHWELLKP